MLAVRSISPVLTFTNTIPAGVAENVPALAPAPNIGNGLASPSQNGAAMVNAASGAMVIVTATVKLSGQPPIPGVKYSTA